MQEFKPDIGVVACGSAQIDFGPPILMNMHEIIEFIKLAPGKVYCNHLEALHHCPATRKTLREELTKRGLIHKVFIPEDGDSIDL